MDETLLQFVRRYVESLAGASGVVQTAVPGLRLVCTNSPTGLEYAISHPLICLVLQGSKEVTMGTRTLAFSAGESLLITADVPTVSQITRASAGTPYLSLVLDLDLSLIAEVTSQMKAGPALSGPAVQVEPTDAEVADSAFRLMRLCKRPAAMPVLQDSLIREMHYWLLAGRHGPAMRHLGYAENHSLRIGRAVELLRSRFALPLPIERLAEVAGMSPSSFYQHFRALTSLSPLQFQKQLRLIEARRLMTSEALSASSAAFAVGYESVQQFSREYRRMFGLPPGKDLRVARDASAASRPSTLSRTAAELRRD